MELPEIRFVQGILFGIGGTCTTLVLGDFVSRLWTETPRWPQAQVLPAKTTQPSKIELELTAPLKPIITPDRPVIKPIVIKKIGPIDKTERLPRYILER